MSSLVIRQTFDPDIRLDSLKEHPRNPRRGRDDVVGDSIEANGFYGAVIVHRKTKHVLAGNTRYRAMKAKGATTIPGLWVTCDDQTAERIMLADNRSSDLAGYDDAALYAMLEEAAASVGGLLGTGYDETDLGALADPAGPGNDSFGDDYGAFSGRTLADRFMAPPFSVLDGRAGYWQTRKRYWIDEIGIRSETGRDANLLNASARMMRSTNWKGTSVFDPVLAELMYRWYSPAGGHVLDPFCGGSVRGLVAVATGLTYEGFDLRPEQIEANEANANAIGLAPGEYPRWRLGDSAEAKYSKPGDLLLTCPPYWSLEQYSDDPADLSNAATPDEFYEGLAACFAPATARLKNNRFAVVVIASMRRDNNLWDLGGMTERIMTDQGMTFFNDSILLTPLASAALRGARLFAGRKLVPVHQRVLIFCKGDPKEALDALPEVDVLDDEAVLASWIDFDEDPE